MKKTILSFLFSIGLYCLLYSQIDYKGFPEWSKKTEGTTQYYLYTPKNLQVGQKYPIALFMHGCCGEDNVARLRNCVDPPVRMWHNFGENTQTIPTYIVSPATSSGWSQHYTNLKTVIDDLVANHQGDPQRIYVCGFSMGGRGTYDFIDAYPAYFAAAIPMGMSFSGQMEETKNVPFWANRGELDSYCTNLPNDVSSIRALNGRPSGSFTYQNALDAYATITNYTSPILTSAVWETGVNPLFSSFKGQGHGVQWDAASTQDLTGWAYTKINDGNYYPNVYFKSPDYKMLAAKSRIGFEVIASDNDGTIAKVEIFVNGILKHTLNASPYKDSIDIHQGDNTIEAKAYDDKGKYNISKIIVRLNNKPMFLNPFLPEARQGALYLEKFFADGNGPFTFKVSDLSTLPAGLSLQSDGLLKGIPLETGDFKVKIDVTDEDKEMITKEFSLNIRAKHANEVLITNALSNPKNLIDITKLRNGDVPNTHSGNEINISNVSIYGGLTTLYPSIRDAGSKNSEYLTFTVSEDVIVRVAYEKMDCTLVTTIPSWLSSYTKDNVNEIAAQYRYFDVYSKNFSKGTIVLPGADAVSNSVAYNYFVMVQKAGTTNNTVPEINNPTVMTAYIGYQFSEYLSVLDGEGNMSWSLASGALPTGINLKKSGQLQGFPETSGTFNFTLKVKDCNGDSIVSAFTINVLDNIIYPVYAQLKDTATMVNSAAITIPLANITNGISATQDFTFELIPDKTSIISLSNPINTGGNNYSFTFTPKADQVGITTVNVKITDKNNPDSALKTTNNFIKIRVLSDKNRAPMCNPISDTTITKTTAKKTILFTGVTDGDGDAEPQTITASVSVTNLNLVVYNPTVTYTKGSKTGTINLYTGAIGTSEITLKLKDDGGNDLGGVDSSLIKFTLTVSSTDLDNQTNENVKIYPNPFNHKITVEINDESYQTLSIIDAGGRTVLLQQIINSKNELDLSDLSAGVYQVLLEGNNGPYTSKIIKTN